MCPEFTIKDVYSQKKHYLKAWSLGYDAEVPTIRAGLGPEVTDIVKKLGKQG